MTKWTNEEIELLKWCYKQEKGVILAYEKFSNRSKTSIRSKALKLGIKNQNFYKDENFFDIPDTINSSVAGIIASDGHLGINGKRREVYITQNTKDDEMLFQILKVTSSNYKIYRRSFKIPPKIAGNQTTEKISYQSTLYFCKAAKWQEDLYKNWRIPTGNKSHILSEPSENLNMDCKMAYIGGIISGDGSIGMYKSGSGKSLKISIWGTLSLLNWIKKTISEYLGKNVGNLYIEEEGKSCHSLYFSALASVEIFKKIESLETVKLSRKWNNPEVFEYLEKRKESNRYTNRFPDILN